MGDGRALALDLGSSSVRAVVVDVEGGHRPVALARRPVSMSFGADGIGVLDPVAYRDAVTSCLDQLQSDAALRGVDVVAVSCQWHSLVVVDHRGDPHSPVLTWAVRSGGPVPEPDEGARELHRQTGCPLHPLYWPMRLPAVRARGLPARHLFVSLGWFVLHGILGAREESLSIASGTGLLDLDRLDWHPDALELAGIRREQLPPLASDHTIMTPAPVARSWPDLTGAVWHLPVGDGAAATVGSGAAESDLAATIGTSAAVRRRHARVPGEHLADGLWRYLVDERTALTGTAWSGGGNVFAWARRVLRVPEGDDDLAALLSTAPAVPGDLVAVPYLYGGRPGNPAHLRTASVLGLGAEHTARDLLVSLVDGVAFELRCGIEQVAPGDRQTTSGPGAVVLGGGAVAGSPWWQQRIADQLGRRVEVVAEPEVAAIGAVALATSTLVRPARVARVPRADAAAAFTERFAAYRHARAR